MAQEIGMYINVRHNGIGETERAIDKLANTADSAEKKAKKLGMTFDSYSKTLSGLQSVAKATGASQESIATANLKVSQTANSLVDSNGKVIASLKRVSDTAQQAGIGTADYFKRLEQMKRSAYTAGSSQKELSDAYLTVTKSAYHLTNSNGDIVRSLSRVADGAKRAKAEAEKLNKMKGLASGLSNFTLSTSFGDFTRLGGLSSINSEMSKLASSSRSASSEITSLNNNVSASSSSFSKLGVIVSGVLSAQTVSKATKMADAMTSLNVQIGLVTDNSKEAIYVQNELFNISNRTFMSIESTAQTYIRASRAMKQYGKSQEEILRFTEAINNSLVVGGTNAAEQASAILQLSQALGAGVLQGGEFRSISRSAPIMLDYIAEYMQVSRGELKKLGAEGKITGEIIFEAMSRASDGLMVIASEMPVTFEGSMLLMRNSFLKLSDEMINQSGLRDKATKSISFIADNLSTVLVPAYILAIATMGRFTSSMIGTGVGFLNAQAGAIKAKNGIDQYTLSTRLATYSSASLATAGKGLSGSLALLGGWGGVLTTVAIGVGAYALTAKNASDYNKDLIKSSAELREEFSKLDSTFISLNENQRKSQITKSELSLSVMRKEAFDLGNEISRLQTKLHGMKFRGTAWNIFGNTTKDIDDVKSKINDLKIKFEDINGSIKITVDSISKMNDLSSNNIGIDSAKFVDEAEKLRSKIDEIGLSAEDIFNKQVDSLVKTKEITDAEGETLKTLNAQKSVLQGLADARSNAVKMIESINQRFENLGKTSIEIEIQAVMDDDSLSIVEAIEAIGKLKTIGASGTKTSIGGSGGSRSNPFKDRQDSLSQELSKIQALNAEYAKYGDPSKYTSAKELTLEFNNQASSLYGISQAQKTILMNQAMQLDSAKQLNEIAMLGSDYGKQIDTLNFELSLTGKMSDEIERLQFFRAIDLKAKELSIGMSAENVKALEKEIAKIKELYDAYGKNKDVNENDYIGGMTDGLNSFIDNAGSARDAFKNATEGALNSMSNGLADFVATGKMNFRDLTQSILQDIAKIMTQWAVAQAVGGIKGMFGFSNGGAVPEFSSGGYTGNGGKYEPKGVVHGGEYVITKEATQRIGIDNLDRLNKGYANRGFVGSVKPSSNGGVQMIVNQSINIESGANIDENMIAQLTSAMRSEMNAVAKRWSLRTVGDQQRNGGLLNA